jgi:hypothetical protein
MPASSEVQICSNALLLIGSRTDRLVHDDGDPALLCREPLADGARCGAALAPVELRDEARGARRRCRRSPTSTGRTASSCQAIACAYGPSGSTRTAPDWQIENGFILMDDAICYVRYIQQLST